MPFTDVAIPLGYAWSSPFARWQGPLAEVSSLDLAVGVTRRALADRGLPADQLTALVLGWTVPQPEIFYGATTVAARIGAEGVTGPMVSQACATGVAALHAAAAEVERTGAGLTLVVTTDRTSNGPTLLYPSPSRPGGALRSEHWVLDNFNRDPWGDAPMWRTAERVALAGSMTREEVDAMALLRHEQYAADPGWHARYLVPVEVPRKRADPLVVDTDIGVHPTTAEGLAKLTAADPAGVVTAGSQTHPADGAAGHVVTTVDRARELAGGEGVARILGVGTCRVGRAMMPMAPVPAARAALADAGLDLGAVDAVTTHNPFAVNDVWFVQQTGFPAETMNAHGSSLVFGHPQGPTGTRLIAQLIETLRERGGGTGLFTGCAAGDTGAAVVLRVE